ncbi:hypothetical protein, partial [Salmonella enterica]|uniref:hypothetical protein n=1 Tax=Salmonella enterica TaxID=28901 RepID=UPI001BAFFA9F
MQFVLSDVYDNFQIVGPLTSPGAKKNTPVIIVAILFHEYTNMSGVYLFTQIACFLVIVMGNDSNLLIVFYVQIM